MTLKITYGDLRNGLFLRVIGKLGSYPFENQKLSYSIMRICRKIEEEIKLADAQFQKTLKEYATLDEKGEFVPADGKAGTFQIAPEKQEAFDKVYQDFCALVVEIDQPPVPVDKLEKLKIAPSELACIDALLLPPMAEAEPGAPIPIRK